MWRELDCPLRVAQLQQFVSIIFQPTLRVFIENNPFQMARSSEPRTFSKPFLALPCFAMTIQRIWKDWRFSLNFSVTPWLTDHPVCSAAHQTVTYIIWYMAFGRGFILQNFNIFRFKTLLSHHEVSQFGLSVREDAPRAENSRWKCYHGCSIHDGSDCGQEQQKSAPIMLCACVFVCTFASRRVYSIQHSHTWI